MLCMILLFTTMTVLDHFYLFWPFLTIFDRTRGPSVSRMRNLYQYKPHYHSQGHVSAWCKEHCNPRNVSELNSVNTVICEQVKFLSTFLFTNILYISISLPSLAIQGLETNVSHQSFWFIQKTVNLDLWLKTKFFFCSFLDNVSWFQIWSLYIFHKLDIPMR